MSSIEKKNLCDATLWARILLMTNGSGLLWVQKPMNNIKDNTDNEDEMGEKEADEDLFRNSD